MSFLTSLFSLSSSKRKPKTSTPRGEVVHEVILGDHTFAVIARPHPQSKRLTLRWDGVRGAFRLTHPPYVTQKSIHHFIHSNHLWMTNIIRGHVGHARASSTTICILGDTYRFVHDPLRSKGIWRVDTILCVGGPKTDEVPLDPLRKFLIEEARQFLTTTSHQLAEQLGVAINGISIRDGRSRWGSCSSSGTLSYSWRIVLADRAVAAYLCAHEVAHLKEMNHSPDFWNHVATLCPHFKESRRWLKRQGHTLKLDKTYVYER